VLHPTGPIYDVSNQKLKPAALSALSRIFKLCDQNNDGVISDLELNDFQRKVFGAPLQQQEIEGVKDVVRQGLPEGVRNNGLTELGFVYLHTLFIQKGRMETVWTVLRSFGYNDQVKLRDSFLHPE
jgi:Ras family protein T1